MKQKKKLIIIERSEKWTNWVRSNRFQYVCMSQVCMYFAWKIKIYNNLFKGNAVSIKVQSIVYIYINKILSLNKLNFKSQEYACICTYVYV